MSTPFDPWRFWWRSQGQHFGLVLAIGGSACLILLIGIPLIWLTLSRGPSEAVHGQILGSGFQETYQGSLPTASVKVDGNIIRIELPARLGCQIGDRIRLKRTPVRLGYAYTVGANTSPCFRPLSATDTVPYIAP